MKYHQSRLLIYFLTIFIVLGVCASNTPLDHIPPLISWLRSNGGTFNNKLEVRAKKPSDPQSLLGIFAKKNIKKNDFLIEIPPKCFITAGLPVIEHSAMKCDTIDYLIREMRLGDASKFAPYLNYLRSQDPGDLPSAWSDKGKEYLMKVLGDEKNTIPSEDIFGWIDDWTNICNITADAISVKAGLLALQRGWDDILIPVRDLISHRNGDWTNVKSSPVSYGEGVRVRATRKIKSGEQLYMSYNLCEGCSRRGNFYGTPEILRDYGFVEQYPQRWIFLHLGLAFDIDEVVRKDSGRSFTEFKVSWVRGKPDNSAKAYFQEEIERLSELNLENEEVPEREARIILHFYNAFLTALEAAIQSVSIDESEVCSVNANECNKTHSRYSNLDEDEDKDDLNHNANDDNQRRLINFENYSTLEFIQSHYQLMEYTNNPEMKDTCLDLDDIVQICGGYRPHYHEMFVHYTAQFLQSVKRVIWIGGGDSMLLHEILKYPSLELAVGLELDQVVTRSSFKHFGTQPHWDNPKVQWWYGDATKSLLMLPRDYFGSFDMVLVDLSETVMSLSVTDELDVMEALSLLLKPEGIFVKNEMYFEEMGDIFDYAIMVNYTDVPHLRSQKFILASKKVDFIHRELTDHGLDNLFIKRLEEIENQYEFIHEYQYNKTSAHKHCKDEKNNKQMELSVQKSSPGILMILEAEKVTTNFQDLDVLQQTMKAAMEKEDLTVISSIKSSSDKNKAVVTIVMKEGFIMARTFSEFNYCALDIQLWSSFEKHDNVKNALTSVIGSSSTSSYRIVTGGMFGVSTWKNDEKRRGPQVNRICDHPSELKGYNKVNQELINIIVEESLDMATEKLYTVAVVCGRKTLACDSVDIAKKNKNVREVLVLSMCPEIYSNNDKSKHTSEYIMLLCETSLLDKIQKMSKTKKVRAIIIDSTATIEMGQIVHKMVEQRPDLFSPRNFMIISMIINDDSEDYWKLYLLDQISYNILKEPAFRAEILLNNSAAESSSSIVELAIASSGDNFFLQRLKNMTEIIETRTKIVPEIDYIFGQPHKKQHTLNSKPTYFSSPNDYDQSDPLKQWTSQQPIGHQAIIQLELEDDKSDSNRLISTNGLILTLESILLQVEETLPEINHVDTIGDGCLIFALWSKGNVVVVWDGRNHVDINLFITHDEESSSSKEIIQIFRKQLKENNGGEMKDFKTIIYDEQPRGYGRVVNFMEDLNDEPRDTPRWAA